MHYSYLFNGLGYIHYQSDGRLGRKLALSHYLLHNLQWFVCSSLGAFLGAKRTPSFINHPLALYWPCLGFVTEPLPMYIGSCVV